MTEQDGDEASHATAGQDGDEATAGQDAKEMTTQYRHSHHDSQLEREGYEWNGYKWVRQDYSFTEGHVYEKELEEGDIGEPEEGVIEEPEGGVVEERIVEEGVVEEAIGEHSFQAIGEESAISGEQGATNGAATDDEAKEDDAEELDLPIETPHFEEESDPLGDGSEFCGFSDDDGERVAQETLDRIPLLDPHHSITSLTVVALPDLKSLQLKKELKARGLATSGKKSQLLNRLQQAMESPEELNQDMVRIQAGEFDSDREELSEDIGIIMARKMKKKPEVEERRKKVWELLEAGMSIKDISQQMGLNESTVQKIQKLQTGGKSAKFKFMRQQISSLLDAKVETKEICRIVACQPRLVYKVVQMKKKGVSIELKHKGADRRIRTEEFLENIWSLRCSDPSMNMNKMAKVIGVSKNTVWRAIREDLCLFSYKHRKTQLVPKRARPKRVRRGKMILDWRAKNPDTVVIWTDEKSWDVDSTKNQQNNRYLAYCVEEVPEKHCTQKPASAMMLGIISSDGKTMPPLWIDRNAKVDSPVYIELLKKVRKWLDETYGNHTPWVFMQDGAPSHTSQETQMWLKENFGADRFWPESMWPPYSCDLNPLDFNIWGFVESHACANAHPSVSALQKSVDKYWKELLTEDHIKKTCNAAWNRITRMIQAKGNTFEPKLKKKKVVSSCSGPPTSATSDSTSNSTTSDPPTDTPAESTSRESESGPTASSAPAPIPRPPSSQTAPTT